MKFTDITDASGVDGEHKRSRTGSGYTGQLQIQLLATATDSACTTIGDAHLSALQDSLDRACGIPARPHWERKAAAHAEFFKILAGATDDPDTARVLHSGARLTYDLMVAVGRAADFIVINSRNRMLRYIRAGNARDASAEVEMHLRVLYFMGRLAGHEEISCLP